MDTKTKRIICPGCGKHNIQVDRHGRIRKHKAPPTSTMRDREGYCVKSNTCLQPPGELVRGIF